MKKTILLIIISAMTLTACQKENTGTNEPTRINCEEIVCESEEAFFATCLINEECKEAVGAGFLYSSNNNILIILGIDQVNGIGEQLFISVSEEADLDSKISLGWNNGSRSPQIVHAWYQYSQGASVAGYFEFEKSDELQEEDYLIIDYYNGDTTILEGHFQVNFPHKRVSSFVTHAPDSMRIECGQFRVELTQ